MPNAPRKKTHFTAVLEVKEVTVTETNPGYPENKTSREVDDVVRIILRADTVAELQGKLDSHVALIEE